MIVKFSGGPKKGKVEEFPDQGWNDRIRVHILERDGPMRAPLFSTKVRTGEYVRSHESLKNGTRIYKWLGWMD